MSSLTSTTIRRKEPAGSLHRPQGQMAAQPQPQTPAPPQAWPQTQPQPQPQPQQPRHHLATPLQDQGADDEAGAWAWPRPPDSSHWQAPAAPHRPAAPAPAPRMGAGPGADRPLINLPALPAQDPARRLQEIVEAIRAEAPPALRGGLESWRSLGGRPGPSLQQLLPDRPQPAPEGSRHIPPMQLLPAYPYPPTEGSRHIPRTQLLPAYPYPAPESSGGGSGSPSQLMPYRIPHGPMDLDAARQLLPEHFAPADPGRLGQPLPHRISPGGRVVPGSLSQLMPHRISPGGPGDPGALAQPLRAAGPAPAAPSPGGTPWQQQPPPVSAHLPQTTTAAPQAVASGRSMPGQAPQAGGVGNAPPQMPRPPGPQTAPEALARPMDPGAAVETAPGEDPAAREQRLFNERVKARGEQRRAQEAAAEEHRRRGDALERAHPGMRARHDALRQQAEAQEKALQQQFPGGPGSSPQAQAAWDALAQDTQRRSQALQQEAQRGHQQSRMQALEASGAIQARLAQENAQNPMGQHGIKDLFAPGKWGESPAEKEQRLQQERQRRETIIAEEMRRHGLDPQHPGHRELLEDAKKFDWSDAVVPDDKGSGGVEHALKGITRSLLSGKDTTAEATRLLSNGALLVNPMLVQNTQAYTDAVKNSDASAEAKQAALDQLPALQIRQAGQMVEALEKTPAGMPGEHFNTFVARRGADAQHGAWFQGLSKAEQAREYFKEQQNRGTLSVWTDYLATHLISGVTQVGAMGLGLLAMPLGKVPIAGEALAAAAGVVNDHAGSMTATTDAETGAGAGMRIVGMLTGMAPAAALTFLSGGSALGGALIAGGTAAGGQYAAGYAEAIRNGMTHEQAWKTQATGALATGVFTALLTKAGGLESLGTQAGQAMAKESLKSLWLTFPKEVLKGGTKEFFTEELPGEIIRTISSSLALKQDPAAALEQLFNGSPEMGAAILAMGGIFKGAQPRGQTSGAQAQAQAETARAQAQDYLHGSSPPQPQPTPSSGPGKPPPTTASNNQPSQTQPPPRPASDQPSSTTVNNGQPPSTVPPGPPLDAAGSGRLIANLDKVREKRPLNPREQADYDQAQRIVAGSSGQPNPPPHQQSGSPAPQEPPAPDTNTPGPGQPQQIAPPGQPTKPESTTTTPTAPPSGPSDQPPSTTVNNPPSAAEPPSTDGQQSSTTVNNSKQPSTLPSDQPPQTTANHSQPSPTSPPPLTPRQAHEILQAHAQNPDALLSDRETQRLDQARKTRAAAIKTNLGRKLEVTGKPLPPPEAKALANANDTLSQPPPGNTNANPTADTHADPDGDTNTKSSRTPHAGTDTNASATTEGNGNTNRNGDTHIKNDSTAHASGHVNPNTSTPRKVQQPPPPSPRAGSARQPQPTTNHSQQLPASPSGQPPQTITRNGRPLPPHSSSSGQSQSALMSGQPSAHGTSTSSTQQPAFPKASASTDDGNEASPNPSGKSSPSNKAKTVDERRRENARLAATRPQRRHPFSNNVTVTEKGLHGEVLRKVTLLTDHAHDDGSSRPVVLDDRVEEEENDGEYLPNHAGVRPGIADPLMTGVHELGHHIALHSLSPEAILRIRDVARDTPTWERIIKRNRKLKYWTDPEEVFCRAYSQFVALSSGDPEILTELNITLNNPQLSFSQWPLSEFARIQKTLEQEFKKIGWL